MYVGGDWTIEYDFGDVYLVPKKKVVDSNTYILNNNSVYKVHLKALSEFILHALPDIPIKVCICYVVKH